MSEITNAITRVMQANDHMRGANTTHEDIKPLLDEITKLQETIWAGCRREHPSGGLAPELPLSRWGRIKARWQEWIADL